MHLDIYTGMLKYLSSCTYEEDLPWLQVEDVCWVDFHVDEELNSVIEKKNATAGRKHDIIQCIIQFAVSFIQSVKQFICLTKRQNSTVTILTQLSSLT